MRRKDGKRMLLSRETLRRLDRSDLRAVAGGVNTDACDTAQPTVCAQGSGCRLCPVSINCPISETDCLLCRSLQACI
jgi:hypothetical protein